ncbi:MMPL family transporter [Paenibacillus sp. PL91]|uniref:MMPL family transporter n=1 Tax=Paenibacillus sp. PL91 TaxID=2729538 RepID=UPI00145CCF22|nr:MMPL family transporter [Paenibacillus sp. PL91]MBC9202761.1 MMPL family transporter [Paenibacillus sp. PL91]
MNIRPLQKVIQYVCSPRGAKISLLCWVLLAIALSMTSPGAKEYAISAGEGSASGNNPAQQAQRLLDEQFPSAEGLPALLVFHNKQTITAEQLQSISELSEWLSSDSKPANIDKALPFHALPAPVQEEQLSEDRTTLLLPVTLMKHTESDQVLADLDAIREKWKLVGAADVQLELTGPAAISADTLTLFRNADVVLMLATVVLILVLLVAIYRSPLLAIIPLAAAGLVYAVVDRLIGLAGKAGLFVIDKQSLSIMMILLFAVITDYCLFVFSRYREELLGTQSKHAAMESAMKHVSEPILFSGGTVLLAMLALFAATFQPYRGFAPVFAAAVAVILLAGLTLVPAVFALLGRKAFWPFVPKVQTQQTSNRNRLWTKIGNFVTSRPKRVAGIMLIMLLLAAINALGLNFSFNLMKSFPEKLGSRQGFELLEQHYPPGELAPVTLVVNNAEDIGADASFAGKLRSLTEELQGQGKIASVIPDLTKLDIVPEETLSIDKRSMRLQLILKMNPYDEAALDAVEEWQKESDSMLRANGFDPARQSLQFAGQTAEQVDVRAMNKQDTLVVFGLITLLITIMLAWQTGSIKLALCMMITILLSYAATLGLSWGVFHALLGYETISYRLPMYSFVFMVALGVDYNIMLVSRVQEEAARHPWKKAIQLAVASTGGVISSAGIILAATFAVLMTQPLQELFLFGFMMAVGILIDTFLVRGMLLPAVMTVLLNQKKNIPS